MPTWDDIRRLFDREVFLPKAAKHGVEVRSHLFLEPVPRSTDEISDGLEDGLLYFGAEGEDWPPDEEL